VGQIGFSQKKKDFIGVEGELMKCGFMKRGGKYLRLLSFHLKKKGVEVLLTLATTL